MRRKSRFRRALRYLLVLIGVAVVGISLALFVSLRTDAGRDWVLRRVATIVEEQAGIRVEADDLRIELRAGSVHLQGIRVAVSGEARPFSGQRHDHAGEVDATGVLHGQSEPYRLGRVGEAVVVSVVMEARFEDGDPARMGRGREDDRDRQGEQPGEAEAVVPEVHRSRATGCVLHDEATYLETPRAATHPGDVEKKRGLLVLFPS